jgi:hypothetical protein
LIISQAAVIGVTKFRRAIKCTWHVEIRAALTAGKRVVVLVAFITAAIAEVT